MSKNFSSGTYINQGYYKAFIPREVNREWIIDDMQVLRLLSQADRHLGRLDMYSEYVNIDLFISMHIAKEATQSSRIEGTRTHVEEAFLEKEDLSIEKRDDWEEVQNYIQAMNEAVQQLHRLPFLGWKRSCGKAHDNALPGFERNFKTANFISLRFF